MSMVLDKSYKEMKEKNKITEMMMDMLYKTTG